MPRSITSGIAQTPSVCATRNDGPQRGEPWPRWTAPSTIASRAKRSSGRISTNTSIAIAGSGQCCCQNRCTPEVTWLAREPASSSTR